MLEGRQLMSLGGEFLVNAPNPGAEFDSANAISANGSSVVVWSNQLVKGHDIRAQLFNAVGQKVGSEFVVSTGGPDVATPSVAIDSHGDFVVAWTQTQSNGDTNVIARKFGPTGIPIGGIVQVGVGTFAETDPHVAMDAAGDFVVSYTRNTNNNNPDIFAKLFNVNEQLVNVVSVSTEAAAETKSSVAMTADGRFYVAYEINFSVTHHDIRLKEYSAQGTLLAAQVITISTIDETNPSVAVDDFGNAVVAWQQNLPSDFNVLAKRVSSTGFVGPAINIATDPNVFELNPSVALKKDGSGQFVVAYDSDFVLVPQVKVAEVSSSNVVTTLNAGSRFHPAVSINNSGQYLLTYTSEELGDLNIRGRFGRLSAPLTVTPIGFPGVFTNATL
jgi:hypothetical protein